MNKEVINRYLNSINKTIKNIALNKTKIELLLEEINKKQIRNENQFDTVINEITEKENKIKSLMDNKYFKYIQFVDFINENNLLELNGFEINKNGALVEKPIKRTANYFLEKQVNSDKKEIIYSFNSEIIYNELEYSFYNSKGVPIIPKNIFIYYDDFEESFYESFFRFYNRFVSNSFLNNFLFTPKNIKKIRFIFNDTINSENDLCILYTNEYKSEGNSNYTLLSFSNYNSINSFNIYKNSQENIPLKFYYSENNIDFEEIKFNNNESVFSLSNSSNFIIKIKSDYENFKVNEVSISDNVSLDLSSLISNDQTKTSYKLNLDGKIEDVDIIIPFSSYILFEEKLKNANVNISDFIIEKDNLYFLDKKYIFLIKEENENVKKMKFYDDVGILSKNPSFCNIYVDVINNNVYIPFFLNDYKISFAINYETAKEQISSKYYTPMLFDLSIKG